ncbi:hypothetical protein GV828_12855 [Flavobacterium sp. NST-5]|uniref:YwqJ-like deaminase n=1 Tax=Flavobacterium ichthyis TaxID=2698827 RepID=A0ABW9ZH28_9FLAO|nr:YwqJ-related putative deaminase [Flavobacterium ichthyis]NBL66088.1 hypothetical protein [Flavobacterium ichthyis]
MQTCDNRETKAVASAFSKIGQSFQEVVSGAKKIVPKVIGKAPSIETLLSFFSYLREKSKNLKTFLDELWEIIQGWFKKGKADGLLETIIKLSDEAEIILKKYADNAVAGYNKLERPSVVSILEGNGKHILAYSNKAKLVANEIPKGFHPLVKKWLTEIADTSIKSRRTHGKCAEPATISKWLWEIDPKGKMKIEHARKEFEGVVSKAIKIESKKVKPFEHATHKLACESCNPLLKYFNINEVH